MSVTRIPIDGLWRCLCPSIDLIASSSSISTPIRRSNANGRIRGRRNFHAGATRRWPAAEAEHAKDVENHGMMGARVPIEAKGRTKTDVKDGGLKIIRVLSTNPVEAPRRTTEKAASSKRSLARMQWEKEKGLRSIETLTGDEGSQVLEKVADAGEKDREGESRVTPIGAFAGENEQGKVIPERVTREDNAGKPEEEGFFEGLDADDTRFSGEFEDVGMQPTETFPGDPVVQPRQDYNDFYGEKGAKSSTGTNQEEVVELRPSTFVEGGEAQKLGESGTEMKNWEPASVDSENSGTMKREQLDNAFGQLDIVEKRVQDDVPVQASAEVERPVHSTSFWQQNSTPLGDTTPYPGTANDSASPDSLEKAAPTTDEVEIRTRLGAKINPMPSQWTAIPARRSPSTTGATAQPIVDQDNSRFQDSRRHPTLHFTNSSEISFQPFATPPRAAELHDNFVSKLSTDAPPMQNINYDNIPLVHLHDRLRKLTMAKDGYFQVCELVTYLLEQRKEQPSLVHYDALIRANAFAEVGDADTVKHLLQEMKELGIGADSALYHGVLQVLAIHPDYLLREQVLQEMKMKWFGLSPEGWHNYVIGLIRDRQYEVAMDKLEQMHSDSIAVQPWLYDIFMFQLCDAGELDEVFKLLKHRYENTRTEILVSTWYYILDAFTKAFYYEGTKFIWQKRIQTQFLVPSDGICTAALNIAARYADPGFATSIVRILSARMPILTPYHYEALLAAYAGSGDMKTAFRILAIMSKASMEPDTNTTRPIFVRLSESADYPPQAWSDLRSLSRDGHTIPVSAANVILEASCETRYFDQAVAFYKELHEIIPTGPNTDTFNTLLQGAVYAGRKDLCMFLASEMAALDIKPDRITYDRLILACLADKGYEDAFRYLEEMVLVGRDKGDGGWWMRQGTAVSMARRCAAASDGRAWKILEEMKERGMKVKEEWVTDNWGVEHVDGSFGLGEGQRGERRFDSAMLASS